ncbi:MAG: tail fiber domain-containing protein [Paracoccaceae bacterium]|nr:tail fiber domain-containing protein [Paracoccaceae bacterium]
MKQHLAAALVSTALAANSALAGGMAEPVMEPAVEPAMIEEDTATGSRAGIIVPILALVMIGLALSQGDDNTAVAPSDARLKTDITRVGTAANGLPLYQFRYVGQSSVYRGVMAQDVLAHRPDAVVTLPGGFLAVDYARLGLELKIIH